MPKESDNVSSKMDFLRNTLSELQRCDRTNVTISLPNIINLSEKLEELLADNVRIRKQISLLRQGASPSKDKLADNVRIRKQMALLRQVALPSEDKMRSDYIYSGVSEILKKIMITIKDEIFALSTNPGNKAAFCKLKLIKARKEDEDFETNLAEMICGENKKFLYRDYHYVIKFFSDLELPYIQNSLKIRYSIADTLHELDTEKIYRIIRYGLFRRKYFIEYARKNQRNVQECIEDARKEFKNFIDESIHCNDVLDLDSAFGLNINTELLFEKESNSDDKTLNDLIKSAKDYFQKGTDEDRQTALEKLWDAFERMKTYYDRDKKRSAIKLIENLPQLGNEFLW